MFAAGLALMAASQVYGGMGAAAEGKAAERLSEYNAKVQEREAKATEERGLVESRRMAKEAARRQSSLEASMGASGVLTDVGTPLQILAEQSEQSEIDIMTQGYNTMVEANRARSQAAADRYSGKIARMRGRNERTGSFLGAGATVLTGFGKRAGSGKED